MIENNSSLREYYIKLDRLYTNAVNMLTAINQSLSTNASEITVNVVDSDDAVQSIRIPSFLYLENKVEQLEMNMDNLFNIPESGEAWFTKSSDIYKLNLVKSNNAPAQPNASIPTPFTQLTDNNILRDMVSPKMFIRVNLDNVSENIETMMMKKLIIYNPDIYNSLISLGATTHSEYMDAIYNLIRGVDYELYESEIKKPIKKNTYSSRFEIASLDKDIENPWTDINTDKLMYKVHLNTLTYTDQEDTSIAFSLKAGDKLCIGNSVCVYIVKNVDANDNSVILEEYIGHVALQPFEENSAMVLTLYEPTYAKYNYVDVPLEENPYVIFFLASVHNGVRSEYSDGVALDLNTIYMKDESGNYILDEDGNKYTYMSYYNKYCKNIGDLILALTETAYPQISNYTPDILQQLQDSDDIYNIISAIIGNNANIEVVSINKHLNDDVTNEDIISLHSQKNDMLAKLKTIQTDIDDTYTTLISTDFSQDVTITQSALQNKIKELYSDRTEAQMQINAIIDNINIKASELNIASGDIKYRIRGVLDFSELDNWLHNYAGENCDIIGLEVEYKYKSTTKNTTNVTTINGSTFTDWVKQNNIDRQRELVFNNNGYSIQYTKYGLTDNIIKWNQIDVPIKNGEDVVLRIRLKYNIGQPFINIYSPWSKEVTVTFPASFSEDIQVNDILVKNQQDTINSTFSKTLINDGYTEHINNKVVSNEQVFYHSPDNIYSGFNTPENNLISLKDKLLSIVTDVEKYKSLVDQQTNAQFDVYLTYDNMQILLNPNTVNKVNIYNVDHITDMYIKKEMNIIIKNTGENTVNLYSIFPGNIDTFLLKSNYQFYNEYITNYERVPIIVNNEVSGQKLGQWIYFRQNNVFTRKDAYLDDLSQNLADLTAEINNEDLTYGLNPENYLNKDNLQVLLGYRRRLSTEHEFENLAYEATRQNEYINENSSYFKMIVDNQNMSEFMRFTVEPGDFLSVLTSYKEYDEEEDKTYKYSYMVTGTYVSCSDNAIVGYKESSVYIGKSEVHDEDPVEPGVERELRVRVLPEGIVTDQNNIIVYVSLDGGKIYNPVYAEWREANIITNPTDANVTVSATEGYFRTTVRDNQKVKYYVTGEGYKTSAIMDLGTIDDNTDLEQEITLEKSSGSAVVPTVDPSTDDSLIRENTTLSTVFYHYENFDKYYNDIDLITIGNFESENFKNVDVEYLLINKDDIYNDRTKSDWIAEQMKDIIAKMSDISAEFTKSYIYKDAGNDVSNKYLVKYEDIIGVDSTGKNMFHLDSKTSLQKFIESYSVQYFGKDKTNTNRFNGAFAYPDLLNISQILTDGTENGAKQILVGETASVPVVFEYYINGKDNSSITKTLMFDIRNSLINNPLHYIVEITGNYDYTSSGDIYSDIDSELTA